MVLQIIFSTVMKAHYVKDENDQFYDNLQSTVCKSKTVSRLGNLRLILKRPVIKWTAVITTITVVFVIIVVPTVLEVTKDDSGRIADNWGNWTSLSECSRSCGGGTQFRWRSCGNPRPAFGGMWCEGNDTDTQLCNNETCPVHGGWGNWKSFSECSHSCGGGTQTRQRECNNPSPASGGMSCSGNQNETKSCNTDVCRVDGNWGSWTEVSECSRSCGGGTNYRMRMCNNPSPRFGGNWCPGIITEFQQCNTQGCPDYRSAFSVIYAVDAPTSGTIKFSTVITNIAGHYETSTGQFTCQYPGIYVIYHHLYKPYSSGVNIDCYIRKNGSGVIRVYLSSGNGNYESSNTVVLHLRLGDKVDLGACSSASTMWRDPTSFSGFLLEAD